MRIAVIADIHGNLPALDAVLADIAARGGADLLVDLGDRASGPLWPRETMDRLAVLDAVTVRGNHDRQVATLAPERMNASDRFTVEAISPAQRDALGALPPAAMVAEGILAMHASPGSDTRYLLERIEGGELVRDGHDAIARRLGEVGNASIVLTGHSHRPDMVCLDSGITIVNPGSVGCPAYDDDAPPHVSETGSPHARYAILTPDPAGGTPSVQFLAMAYDHEGAARRAEANGRPDWAGALRTGFMRA
tara:strand:- start:1578 stop:2327 length:750 start_codon:yes stop_codon:yes gene_type:complete